MEVYSRDVCMVLKVFENSKKTVTAYRRVYCTVWGNGRAVTTQQAMSLLLIDNKLVTHY